MKIHRGAKFDEGEFTRAMNNRNCKTTSELLQLLIKEAARAPPKRSHKKKPAKCNNIVHALQRPAPVITVTPQIYGGSKLPNNLINQMKFLLIDRDKRGQKCDREWFTEYIKKNYPLEASVDLEAMLDTIFTIIKRR